MKATLRMPLAACAVGLALLSSLTQTRAQTPAAPPAGVDAGLLEDIVIGSRILADFGVLDGFVVHGRQEQTNRVSGHSAEKVSAS